MNKYSLNVIERELFERVRNIPAVQDVSDNLFSVLEINSKEKYHSRVLKYLIARDWNGFCEHVLCKHGLGSLTSVVCEYAFEHGECEKFRSGKIDIFCETDKSVVAIEVKWNADDQPQQLLRYFNQLVADFGNKDRYLYYLTKDKHNASAKSLTCGVCDKHGCAKTCLTADDYERRSFAEHVLKWLEHFDDNRGGEIARLYYDILKWEFAMTEFEKQIDSRDMYFAAVNIQRARENLTTKIRREFLGAFDRALEKAFGRDLIKESALDGKRAGGANCLVYRTKCDRYFVVKFQTSLYWQIGNGVEWIDNDPWSYVDNEWFDGDGKYDQDMSAHNTKTVSADLLDDSNKAVEWYFSDPEKKTEQMNNIMVNLRKYLRERGGAEWA